MVAKTARAWCVALLPLVAGCGGRSGSSSQSHEDTDAAVVADAASTPDASLSVDGGAPSDASPALDALPPQCQGALTFADPAIEADVRARIDAGSGAITAQDVLSVTTVQVTDAGSLSGLECVIHLQHVIAQGGSVSDLSPLSALDELVEVHLPDSKVSDLSPLTNHPNLLFLVAPNNQVTTLAGLSLPAVDSHTCNTLDLRGNPVGVDQFSQACSQGWYALWGGSNGVDAGTCGSQAGCQASGGR